MQYSPRIQHSPSLDRCVPSYITTSLFKGWGLYQVGSGSCISCLVRSDKMAHLAKVHLEAFRSKFWDRKLAHTTKNVEFSDSIFLGFLNPCCHLLSRAHRCHLIGGYYKYIISYTHINDKQKWLNNILLCIILYLYSLLKSDIIYYLPPKHILNLDLLKMLGKRKISQMVIWW